jgi:hypothetical protein
MEDERGAYRVPGLGDRLFLVCRELVRVGLPAFELHRFLYGADVQRADRLPPCMSAFRVEDEMAPGVENLTVFASKSFVEMDPRRSTTS